MDSKLSVRDRILRVKHALITYINKNNLEDEVRPDGVWSEGYGILRGSRDVAKGSVVIDGFCSSEP